VTETGRAKVLILDGHSKAAAASVLALPRKCALHVAAMEDDCVCFASRRVAERHRQPREPEALRDWLRDLHAREDFDLVIPSTEASLLAVKARDLDPILRSRCVLASEASLDTALDKRRTLELAARLGVLVPQGALIASIDEAVEPLAWPVVVKPIHSKVATGTQTLSLQPRICVDVPAWNEALAEFLPFTPVLVQEYFRGYGVGVEVLYEHGQARWLFAHRRIHEWPVTGGASSYRRAIPVPPALYRATLDLLGELAWHGVAMVEFKLADNGDYRLMEINPRLWGSLPLAIGSGVNFPMGLLRLATGQSPGPQPEYGRYYARDVVKDLHWFEDSIRQRHNPLRLSPVRLSDWTGWLRPLIGREHWDLFRWREQEMWRFTLRPALAGLRARAQRRSAVRRSRANWRKLRSQKRLQKILILCYGNICRSPVAAALLQRTRPDLTVTSSGFHQRVGRPSPDDWMEVVSTTLGLDLHAHRSRVVDAPSIAEADLILVMDARNWRTLAKSFPGAMSKTVLLGLAAGGPAEIPDPFDEDAVGRREIAVRLGAACEAFARRLAAAGVRPT
jgi:protein-tyrosine-phosphatase/predicted ATP-grasp superfamily ATP-dependent carboligase